MIGKLSMVLGVHAILFVVLIVVLWSEIKKFANDEVGRNSLVDPAVGYKEPEISLGQQLLVLKSVVSMVSALGSLFAGLFALRPPRLPTTATWPARVGLWCSSLYGLAVVVVYLIGRLRG